MVKPEKIDLYGTRKVYEGAPDLSGEHRYLVWYGGKTNKKGWLKTYRTLFFAVRRARILQRQGKYVRVSDRLIQDGDERAFPVTERTF